MDGNGGGEDGRAVDASSSAVGGGTAGGGAGSDVGDISVFLGEDWSDLWLEGNTGELDFSFFDFAAPN